MWQVCRDDQMNLIAALVDLKGPELKTKEGELKCGEVGNDLSFA